MLVLHCRVQSWQVRLQRPYEHWGEQGCAALDEVPTPLRCDGQLYTVCHQRIFYDILTTAEKECTPTLRCSHKASSWCLARAL